MSDHGLICVVVTTHLRTAITSTLAKESSQERYVCLAVDVRNPDDLLPFKPATLL